MYFNAVIAEINIPYIQSHAFRDTDSRSQQQRHKRQISFFCLFVIHLLACSQTFSGFHLVQQPGHFVNIKTHNILFVNFRHVNLNCRIIPNQLILVEIAVEGAERSKLPFDAPLVICVLGSVLFIIFQVEEVFLNVHRCDFVQNRQRYLTQFHPAAYGVFPMQIIKKTADIVGICDAGAGRGCGLDTDKKLFAERR